ncbi:MAG: phospholipid/cholesterol/gamma-HCH transport system substrate-binding protein [Solirubrobacteraceae bacterium]|jgi:virulence factor Mce-like protein|nr:phospholipid/cholesterol/gamma-HCH transport system substrate-binding protein [Solirubrobacteraceae bacterium]
MKGGSNPRVSNFALGVLAMAGIALFVYLAFAKRVPFTPRHEVQAIFASSNQLREGSPVRIAGVDVGAVTRIQGGPGTTAVVTMTLSKEGRPLHTDATAKIRPRVFLEGGYFVELRPGSPRAPRIHGKGPIPLPQTSVPVQLHQVLGALDRPTRESFQSGLAETATALDGGGAAGLRRALPPLAPALRDTAWLAEAARGTTPGDLARLVSSSATVTRVLAARSGDLADSVTSLNRIASALAANDAALAASVRGLDGVLVQAPPALRALDRAMPPLKRFAAALRPGLRLAPRVLGDTAGVLTQLDALAGEPARPSDFVRIVIQLKPVLPEIPRLALLARGLFPLVGPIVTCLTDNVVPTLNSKLDDGALSTGRPVWQDLVHALVGFAGGSQNFDANGPWVRYLGSTGVETLSTGDVPGAGRLFGGTAEPLSGARPVWRGSNGFPPLRPDQPCARQKPPDLRAEAGLPAGGG